MAATNEYHRWRQSIRREILKRLREDRPELFDRYKREAERDIPKP